MKSLVVLICMIVNLLSGPLVINDSFTSQNAVGNTDYLITQTKEIEQLDTSLFSPLKKANLGLIGNNVVWTKVQIFNNSSTQKRIVARNTRPGTDEITMYLLRDNRILESHTMGDTLPFSNRPLKTLHSAMVFSIEAHESVELYSMYANKGVISVETILYSISEFFYTESRYLMQALLFSTLMFVVIIYTLYLSSILKRAIFLFYAIHFIVMFLYFACVNGLFYYLTEGEMIAFQEFIVYYGIFLGIAALAYFDVHFFNLKTIAPKFYTLVSILFSISLVALFSFVLQKHHPIFQSIASFSPYFMALFYAVTEIILFYVLYKRLPYSFYYFLGHTAYMTGTIVYFQTIFGKIEETLLTQNAGMIGIIIEGLIVAFAVHQSLRKSLDEKQKAEELLVTHSQFLSVGRQLAAIVHQWKVPLYRMSTITMYLESLLLHKHIDAEKIAPSVEQMNQTIAFMDETITSFHHFYKREETHTAFNLLEKIERIINMLKPLLESHCIVVRNQCEPSITLNSKSDILGHVVLIIIQNAINALSIATHKERQITLSTFTTSSHIGICVEDNGGGIEPSKLNHLFSKTLKSKSGLGFGLHLAHFLTSKELSGAIKAYNTHQGAKFELVVPLK